MVEKDLQEDATLQTSISFGSSWLKKPLILSILMGFGILLCAFLNRCYHAMPWDEWTILGIHIVDWRKPIAAGLLSASIWSVGISVGCLFWWMLSWVTGAGWSAGLRRVWENWANSGLGAWMALLATVCIMTTVVFPWADRLRDPSIPVPGNVWFFNVDMFMGRQGIYLLVIGVLAMVARSCSLNGDLKKGDKIRRYERNMRSFSAVSLPVVVILTGMMGIDWIAKLSDGAILSMWPLFFVSYAGVVALAASTATASLTLRYRGGSRSGLERGHLGALLLAALLFKAYFGYSQFLVTFYSGLPAEQSFYAARLAGCWHQVAGFCAIGGVLLPIMLLLIPAVRRNSRLLGSIAIWLVLASAIEALWMVAAAMGLEITNMMLVAAFGVSLVLVVALQVMHVLSSMSRERCFAVDFEREIS